VDPKASDAISRTIREIQDPNPGFRTQIWSRTLHPIMSEQDRLLFGRGIGMFPVNDGFGAPNWPLSRVEGAKHYPHNVHLEVLYETGILGLLLFSIATLAPVIILLWRWGGLSAAQRSIVSMYVFILISCDLSGSFAYSYNLQFFLALTVGIVALTRAPQANASG